MLIQFDLNTVATMCCSFRHENPANEEDALTGRGVHAWSIGLAPCLMWVWMSGSVQ
jgi:hypothetical protein